MKSRVITGITAVITKSLIVCMVLSSDLFLFTRTSACPVLVVHTVSLFHDWTFPVDADPAFRLGRFLDFDELGVGVEERPVVGAER